MNTSVEQLQISVVICCYNYEHYVSEAICSALCQSYANKEIIVVNDGSSDGSLTVIRHYLDSITLLDRPNGGHVSALNAGFAATHGAWVLFLDADDLLLPGALAAIASVCSDDHSKVQYDMRIIDGDGRDLGRRFCNFPADFDERAVRESVRATGTYCWPVSSGNAYARSFLQQVFPLIVKEAPDGFLNSVAPFYGRVATLHQPFACYRLHGSNLWGSSVGDPAQLPRRIANRLAEVRLLREHAARRGFILPADNILDFELPFLNYRLMALRLGVDYPGRDRDSRGALWRSAMVQLHRQRLPGRLTLGHRLWFSVLLVAPVWLVHWLIRLRYNRAAPLMSRLRAQLVRASEPS